MSDDSLHTPLRPRRWRDRLRLRTTPAKMTMALLALAMAAGLAWVWMTPPPPVTETVVERSLPQRPASADPGTRPSTSARQHPSSERMAPVAAENNAGGVGTKAGKGRPGPKIIDVSKLPDDSDNPPDENERDVAISPIGMRDFSSLSHAPRRELVEKTAFGLLPKRGPKGLLPWRAYARPTSASVLSSTTPKLAVLVTDVGLNGALVQKAMRELPPEVSLALVPHLRDTARLGHEARRTGHEFFLQVPMEPWGYPAVDPGPKTLLSTSSAANNRKRLRWLLGRAVGYVGVVNYAGQKFLQHGEALSPILHELKNRGLMAVDDGTAANSMMQPLGLVISLPVVRADVRVSPDMKPAAARSAFDRARDLAMRRGHALLVVSASAHLLKELADWLGGIEGSGDVVLVPVTALARMSDRK